MGSSSKDKQCKGNLPAHDALQPGACMIGQKILNSSSVPGLVRLPDTDERTEKVLGHWFGLMRALEDYEHASLLKSASSPANVIDNRTILEAKMFDAEVLNAAHAKMSGVKMTGWEKKDGNLVPSLRDFTQVPLKTLNQYGKRPDYPGGTRSSKDTTATDNAVLHARIQSLEKQRRKDATESCYRDVMTRKRINALTKQLEGYKALEEKVEEMERQALEIAEIAMTLMQAMNH